MKPVLRAALLGAWLLSVRVGAQQYDIRVFGVEDGLPGSTVTNIAQDSTGFLWVETAEGCARFDGKHFAGIGTLPGQGVDPARFFKEGGSRALGPSGLEEPGAVTVDLMYGDRLLITERGLGLRATGPNNSIIPITSRNGLKGTTVRCVYQDRSGVVWMGTEHGGLIRFTGNAVTWFDEHNGLQSPVVTGIERLPDGRLAITTIKGSQVWDPQQYNWVALPRTTDSLLVQPHATIRLPEGHQLLAMEDGLYDKSPDGTIKVGRDSLAVLALAIAGDSVLIGTHRGLYRAPLDNSAANWTPVIRAGEEDITSLAYDRAGTVWIGTAGRGVQRLEAGGTKRWGIADDLSSDHVRSLLLDAYQNLWVGTDRGFDLLELDELQEQVIDIQHFGLEEGFPGIEAMRNAAMLDTDSALWFGTTRGAIRFDPRRVFVDPVPPRTRLIDLTLFFEHVDWKPWSTGRGADGLPTELELPYNKNHLTFTFSGLSLAYPEKVRFQYMLEGRDSDWSPITAEDHVTYSGLEPGSYTFLVKARNGSGVWNDEPARYTFTITPPIWRTTGFRITGAAALLLAFLGMQYLRERRSRKARERLERIVALRTRELTEEKHRSDSLLLNILPETTAAELKERGTAQARSYAECTVLFSDFQGFTVLSEQFEATGIVTELDRFFRAFDRITDKFGTEKIKTIGDAYMCASGVPEPSPTHALDAVLMALEMLSVVDEINALRISEGHPAWPIRIGLNSGPLIAGVVGEKKFAYDVWGDTVNLASRMESNGAPGRVNVTGSVMRHVEPYVISEARGRILIKGKGEIESWFVDRLRPEFSDDPQGRVANARLMEIRNKLRGE